MRSLGSVRFLEAPLHMLIGVVDSVGKWSFEINMLSTLEKRKPYFVLAVLKDFFRFFGFLSIESSELEELEVGISNGSMSVQLSEKIIGK